MLCLMAACQMIRVQTVQPPLIVTSKQGLGRELRDTKTTGQTSDRILRSGQELVSMLLQDLGASVSVDKQSMANGSKDEDGQARFQDNEFTAMVHNSVALQNFTGVAMLVGKLPVASRAAKAWELCTVFGLTIVGSILLFAYIFYNPLAKVADAVPRQRQQQAKDRDGGNDQLKSTHVHRTILISSCGS